MPTRIASIGRPSAKLCPVKVFDYITQFFFAPKCIWITFSTMPLLVICVKRTSDRRVIHISCFPNTYKNSCFLKKKKARVARAGDPDVSGRHVLVSRRFAHVRVALLRSKASSYDMDNFRLLRMDLLEIGLHVIEGFPNRCCRSCLQHQSCKTGMLGDKTKYRLVDALALARKGTVRDRWGLVPHGHFDA
ncbi:hypothetical protein M9H77_31399 [Catharanthus roseus]|uniref:Uncharacterized protein n=1 Tax=Catharanthus roseus TaxID=4058 RepID=A0ACC0A2N1_CATRO|nr:hypothetical protein M9H77_31399 [Catharanthus roseus]